jgi:hypothetical protein
MKPAVKRTFDRREARAKARSSPPCSFIRLITPRIGEQFHHLKLTLKLSRQRGAPHELYTGLAELEKITPEDKKLFDAASSHFSSEAESLQEQMPSEPDMDDSGSGSHSSAELDVNELFSDL